VGEKFMLLKWEILVDANILKRQCVC